MARFVADENFPFPVTEALRHLGHDVVTLHDLGRAGQALADRAVLELASADTHARRGMLDGDRADITFRVTTRLVS